MNQFTFDKSEPVIYFKLRKFENERSIFERKIEPKIF